MIKHYIIKKNVLLKNPIYMLLTNFIFVVSHLKLHPDVHLITLKDNVANVVKKESLLKV